MPAEGTPSGRSCNGCTLCCRAIPVDPLQKAAWTECAHCDVGRGCTIYDTRPNDCATWLCGYLLIASIPQHWYPKDCGMVLYVDGQKRRLEVRVSPETPEAWRVAPYYQDIKRWAAWGLNVESANDAERVYVRVQGRTILILPDRDVDLGVIEDGEQIVLIGPFGDDPDDPGRWKVCKRKPGAPLPSDPEAWS